MYNFRPSNRSGGSHSKSSFQGESKWSEANQLIDWARGGQSVGALSKSKESEGGELLWTGEVWTFWRPEDCLRICKPTNHQDLYQTLDLNFWTQVFESWILIFWSDSQSYVDLAVQSDQCNLTFGLLNSIQNQIKLSEFVTKKALNIAKAFVRTLLPIFQQLLW